MEYRPVQASDAKNIADMYLSLFWRNLNVSEHSPPPDIDLDLLIYYHEQGLLIGLVGEDEGELRSCYLATKGPYVFEKGKTISNEVLWFLHPSIRKEKDVFKDFIKEIHILNFYHGVDLVSLSMPYRADKQSKSSKLMDAGYTRQDVNYLKYLGE